MITTESPLRSLRNLAVASQPAKLARDLFVHRRLRRQRRVALQRLRSRYSKQRRLYHLMISRTRHHNGIHSKLKPQFAGRDILTTYLPHVIRGES